MVSEVNTAFSPAVSVAQNNTNNSNTTVNGAARIYHESIPHQSSITTNQNNLMNQNNTDNSEKKKKVGNYIISKTIGEGSFAKVRLGYHLITQQMVAVKVINKREVLKRNYLRANLRREACMMQRMQHSHIIQLFEVMETENCYYIVMELIDGIEFVKYLSKKRSLDENETRLYIRQIVSAVDHMHKAKVVHRDIKLQNFMLDQNQNLTIIDFGLSNSLDDREFLNTQCGSPAYAAPEIFAHQDYGAEVDIWSIGVNMYAMLAGKLPFKVENRSKNLAKLHACILKGFEVPPFLSPDCQDLLCKLLDSSPNKRIKMHEILSHPWINYNCLPIEIVPYKPVVDIKEIKPNIVQYLVQKHDYAENDIIDAIIHRKPIALKAIYYLIEKRLKMGLSFPDAEYDNLLEKDNRNFNNRLFSNNNNNIRMNGNENEINNFSETKNIVNINNNTNNNGIIKQNSQLLPKRHGVQVPIRSSSQKNVDFKSLFNNMNQKSATSKKNSSNNVIEIQNNEIPIPNNNSNNNNNNNAMSPSPDFIAAAMSPVKYVSNQQAHQQTMNIQLSSAHQRALKHADLSRKVSNSSTSNRINETSSINDIVRYSESRHSAASNLSTTQQNDYKIERYFSPTQLNHNHHQMVVIEEQQHSRAFSNNNNSKNIKSINGENGGSRILNYANSIRSLPSSIYRASPERNLPRSSERVTDFNAYISIVNPNNNNNNNNLIHSNNYRPTTSKSSIKSNDFSVMNDVSNNQNPKTSFSNKRSLTSCEESTFENRQKNQNNINSIIKNRQLHLGKAKIDLDTQQGLNVGNGVGITIKNIGAFSKPSLTRSNSNNNNNSETQKIINNINMKQIPGYKNNSIGQSSNLNNIDQQNQNNQLHLNQNNSNNQNNGVAIAMQSSTNNKTKSIQQAAVNLTEKSSSALPRIHINS